MFIPVFVPNTLTLYNEDLAKSWSEKAHVHPKEENIDSSFSIHQDEDNIILNIIVKQWVLYLQTIFLFLHLMNT